MLVEADAKGDAPKNEYYKPCSAHPNSLADASRAITRSCQFPGKIGPEDEGQPGNADDGSSAPGRITEPRRWPVLQLTNEAQDRDHERNQSWNRNQLSDTNRRTRCSVHKPPSALLCPGAAR